MAAGDDTETPQEQVAEAQADAGRDRERTAARQEKARVREGERTGQRDEGQVPTYPRERMFAESSDLVGCEPNVLSGALALAGQTKKNLTRDEATEAVAAFLAHEDTTQKRES